mgnify:CR=1 FL=1
MRRMEYLSPTSISLWEQNRDEFYITYLSENRAPRFPQTVPMSIGSSFDAYVKSFLHGELFGKGYDPRFELKTLFEAQVEPQNRDRAWEDGAHAFECYKRSGALADLMTELQQSVGTPRFEIEVKGAISGSRESVSREIGDVVFLGKPDVFYVNKSGCYVILDFKVNGWYSTRNVSPMKGYIRIRSGSGVPILSGPHKDCIPMAFKGTMINCGLYLEDCDEGWAKQLSIYGWLCGVDVGDEFVTAIDQIACKPSGGKFPEVRIAEHRLRIRPDFQRGLYQRAQEIWEIVHSNHIFRELSLADSQAKCEMLDRQAEQLAKPVTLEDKIFNQITRG